MAKTPGRLGEWTALAAGATRSSRLPSTARAANVSTQALVSRMKVYSCGGAAPPAMTAQKPRLAQCGLSSGMSLRNVSRSISRLGRRSKAPFSSQLRCGPIRVPCSTVFRLGYGT